jgi:class 3 adenylate cyclase/tetratricopeptide (TPR) repeat protein
VESDTTPNQARARSDHGGACSACGTQNLPTHRFCGGCGRPLGTAPAPSPLGATERRHLTVLFCDLVGSTPLGERIDPEDLQTLLATYHGAARRVIERYGGFVAEYLGDGVVVYFGYPHAREDDAERAVRAGLELIAAVAALDTDSSGDRRGELAARVGVHSGVIVVSKENDPMSPRAVGHTMNLAARLQGAAPVDGLVASDATLRALRGSFVSEPIGPLDLKGISTPVVAHRIEAPRSRAALRSAPGATLVARERELGVLLDRFERARSGNGQIVAIEGEAGIGKSRLVRALEQAVRSDAHVWLEATCSRYSTNTSFHPVIDLVRLRLDEPDEAPYRSIDTLARDLAHADAAESLLPRLAELIGIEAAVDGAPAHGPEVTRKLTIAAVVEWLLSLGRNVPAIAVLEDVHWADPSTLEVLQALRERISWGRLLLVVTHRPELSAPFTPHPNLERITLLPLTAREIAQMVADVEGSDALPAALVQEIVAKSDGVPLFAEELTKSVLEARSEAVRSESPGAAALAIPTTLGASLLARLDRLGEAKRAAQLGAVIGRAFSREAIRQAWAGEDGDLDTALEKLVAAELVYPTGPPRGVVFTFKHALIQDAAYDSMLRSQRRGAHERVADWLARSEGLARPDAEVTPPELVARHYEAAGRPAVAIEFYRRAGEQANRRSATQEAMHHLSRAIELLRELPDATEEQTNARDDLEIVLQVAIGAASIRAHGSGSAEVARAFGRARELCRDSFARPELFAALCGLVIHAQNRSELDVALDLSARLIDFAERRGDPSLVLSAHYLHGASLFWIGRFGTALEHLEVATRLYDVSRDAELAHVYGTDPGVESLSYSALCLWALGFPERAEATNAGAVELAERIEHPFSLASAYGYALIFHWLAVAPERALSFADRCDTIARTEGFAKWLGVSACIRAFALAQLDPDAAGSAALGAALAASQETMAVEGTLLGAPAILSAAAELELAAGRVDPAVAALDGGLAFAESSGQHGFTPEILRLKGKAALARDPTAHAEAERWLLRSIDAARAESARMYELRATTTLAELRARQGRTDEAREALSRILATFDPESPLPDLVRARAVRSALARAD